MPAHHDDELPTLEAADLSKVTGGAGTDMMSLLLPMMIMRSRAQSATVAAPAPDPAAAWKPKVMVNGVEQQLTAAGNGTFTVST